jgi:adenylyltransferase/sulfurtransferase
MGCGEGGILGPVVGVMGVLQALEALKLIARGDLETTAKEVAGDVKAPTMLLFSGAGDTSFRSVRMRGRRKACFACGDPSEGGGELSVEMLQTSMDYVQFCGVVPPIKVLKPEERISARQYAELVSTQKEPPPKSGNHILIDVREKEHFDMSHLDGAVNLPLSKVTAYRGEDLAQLIPGGMSEQKAVYAICHRGNDSQIVAEKLKASPLGRGRDVFIGDIEGGMLAWRAKVDPSLPLP